MTRNDWLCPVCGDVMVCPSGKYMVCINQHEKLIPAYCVDDLPYASYGTGAGSGYNIDGHGSGWSYVPHQHKTCLEQAPPEGFVVAAVAFRGRRAARLFRRKANRKKNRWQS